MWGWMQEVRDKSPLSPPLCSPPFTPLFPFLLPVPKTVWGCAVIFSACLCGAYPTNAPCCILRQKRTLQCKFYISFCWERLLAVWCDVLYQYCIIHYVDYFFLFSRALSLAVWVCVLAVASSMLTCRVNQFVFLYIILMYLLIVAFY